jgi:hypothetical protein
MYNGSQPAVTPRFAARLTMERYTMVPDEATLAALERLSDAMGSADAVLPDGLARANPLSLSVLGGNSFQCPSETTSTVPSVTLMAV